MWLKKRGVRIHLTNPADIAHHKALGYVELVEAVAETPAPDEPGEPLTASAPVEQPDVVADVPPTAFADVMPAEPVPPSVLEDEPVEGEPVKEPKKAVKK